MQEASRGRAGTGVAGVLLGLALAAPAGAQPLSAPEIAARAEAAVLVVRAFGAAGDTLRLGTGFLVSADGLFVTNYHVIGDAAALEVEAPGGAVHREVEVVAADAARDLALLRLPGAPALASLPLGSDAEAAVGERIYVMGHPLGMLRSFGDGLLSARRPVEGVAMLQISAPTAPGSSGGPVLNGRGEVIGVVTLFAAGAAGLNLAVPVRYLRSLLEVSRAPRRFAPGVLPPPPPQGLVLVGAPAAAGTERASGVRRQAEALTALLRRKGWAAARPALVASAAPGEAREHALTLAAGTTYLLTALCDAHCHALEMAVVGSDGSLLQTASGGGDFPTLGFTPTTGGVYRLRVTLTACTTAACGYGIGVYTRPAAGHAAASQNP